MARTPPPFRQADVTRAVRGVTAAGVVVGRVEFEPGKIVVHAAQPEATLAPTSPLDEWRARRDPH